MFKPLEQKLSSWILWGPLRFAFISFVLMLVTALLFGGIISHTPLVLMLTLMFGVSAWLVLRRMPTDDLDRPSFVAVNTAQMFITSVAFILSTLLIVSNAQQIMLRLLWLETHSSFGFMAIITLASLFYLYLSGLFLCNIYAKFRRARAMGISTRRVIFTLPFGFPMLWIPGYILPTPTPKNRILMPRAKWYAALTNKIVSSITLATLVLLTLIILSGFFFGFNSILVTLGLGVIFAVWMRIIGPAKFAQNINGRYTSVAIVINLIILATTVILTTLITAA